MASSPRTPTRRLILVRHGDSVRGPDEALTDAGREQARLTGARLAALPRIDRIVHSPMPRAVQTATLLAASLDLGGMAVDDRLAECTPSVPARDLLTYQQHGQVVEAAADGAGAAQAAAAVAHFLAPPDPGGPDRVDLLVSHANLLRWLITTAIGAGDNAWFQLAYYHCALSAVVLRTSRPPAVLAVNDATHLPAHLRGDDHGPDLHW